MATEIPNSMLAKIYATTHLVLAGFVLKELQEQGWPRLVCLGTAVAPMYQGG